MTVEIPGRELKDAVDAQVRRAHAAQFGEPVAAERRLFAGRCPWILKRVVAPLQDMNYGSLIK